MKKINAYEIALSAMACALATLCMTVGVYTDIFLFTGYLLGGLALMIPLARQSYKGYFLAYAATCILSLIFNAARFWNVLPFIIFFGLHPVVNEWQLKIKINRWLACGIKALWFDLTMLFVWKFVFGATTSIPLIDQYILPFVLIFGSLFFVFYDYLMYRWRAIVFVLVKRISKK
jgi:hypothetical protein